MQINRNNKFGENSMVKCKDENETIRIDKSKKTKNVPNKMEKTIIKNKEVSNRKIIRFFLFYETSIPLLQRMSTPAIIIVILLIFWNPIKQITYTIPNLIERTSNITIGDFSILISTDIEEVVRLFEDALFSNPPEGMSVLLEGLSKDELLILLRQRSRNIADYTKEVDYCDKTRNELFDLHPGVKELESKGLVTIAKEKKCPEDFGYVYIISAKGREVKYYIHEKLTEAYIEAWERSK